MGVTRVSDEKAVIAFVFPLPADNNPFGLQAVVGRAKTLFEDRDDVRIYSVIRKPAELIAHILTRKERSETALDVKISESGFDTAEDIESLLFQLAGAASVCWEDVGKAGVFESDRAKEYVEDALIRLAELLKPSDIKGDFIDIGPQCFTDGDVISYKGENFYRACGELVAELEGGGRSHCVKRIGHPGNQHEDYDGRRLTKMGGA